MKKLISLLCAISFMGGCLCSNISFASSTGPLWADYIVSQQSGIKKSKRKQPKKMYLTVFHYDGGEIELGKEEKKRLMRTVNRLDKGTIKSVRFICYAKSKKTCTARIKKMQDFISNHIMGDHFRYTIKVIQPENNVNKSNSLKVIEK